MDGGVGNYAANEPRNLPKATMERKAKKSCHRAQTEVCFVRNLELLHNDQLRLVMRDKIAPLMVGGDDSLQRAAFAAVRVAHSDEALAVMFEVEAAHSVGTMKASFQMQEKCFSVEISSDGEKMWLTGVSDQAAVRHFGSADAKRWQHIVVIPFAIIDLCNNAKGVEAQFEVSVVDSLASTKEAYADLTLHGTADLV